MKKYIILLSILAFLPGCRSPLLDSSIAIKNTILPEYIELVQESKKYSKLEKKYRIRNAIYYKEVVEAAEKD